LGSIKLPNSIKDGRKKLSRLKNSSYLRNSKAKTSQWHYAHPTPKNVHLGIS